jgi:hypothetical protein
MFTAKFVLLTVVGKKPVAPASRAKKDTVLSSQSPIPKVHSSARRCGRPPVIVWAVEGSVQETRVVQGLPFLGCFAAGHRTQSVIRILLAKFNITLKTSLASN